MSQTYSAGSSDSRVIILKADVLTLIMTSASPAQETQAARAQDPQDGTREHRPGSAAQQSAASSDGPPVIEAADMVADLQRQIVSLKEQIQSIMGDKSELVTMMKLLQSKPSTTAHEDEMKGCDSKNIKRPDAWAGNKEEFLLWNVLFQAYMSTFDKRWKWLLKNAKTWNDESGSDVKLVDSEVDKLLEKNGLKASMKEDL